MDPRGVSLILFLRVGELIKKGMGEFPPPLKYTEANPMPLSGYPTNPDVWTVARVSNCILGTSAILQSPCKWGEVDLKTTVLGDKATAQCSLVNYLRKNYSGSDLKHPDLGVSYEDVVSEKATVFVSFAYETDFFVLIDTLLAFFNEHKNLDPHTTYFSFDPFVNDQWVNVEKLFEFWSVIFREALTKIGRTLLIFNSWENPVLLTRAWCLYEIAYSSEESLSVGLSSAQRTAFVSILLNDYDKIMKSLVSIDMKTSKAREASEIEQIHNVVKQESGFQEINARIAEKLRRWLITTAATEIQMRELQLKNSYCRLLRDQGQLQKAIDINRASLANIWSLEPKPAAAALSLPSKEEELEGGGGGGGGAAAASVSVCRKITCPDHGEFEQAPNTHLGGCGCKRCASLGLELTSAKLTQLAKDGIGIVNHAILDTYELMARLLKDNKEFKMAYTCYTIALNGWQTLVTSLTETVAIINPNDPDLVMAKLKRMSVYSLRATLTDDNIMDKQHKSTMLLELRSGVDQLTLMKGSVDEDTLRAKKKLAKFLHYTMGKDGYEEALELYNFVLEERKQKLGLGHDAVLTIELHIALLCLDGNEKLTSMHESDALKSLEHVLAGREIACGKNNHRTCQVLERLAFFHGRNAGYGAIGQAKGTVSQFTVASLQYTEAQIQSAQLAARYYEDYVTRCEEAFGGGADGGAALEDIQYARQFVGYYQDRAAKLAAHGSLLKEIELRRRHSMA